MQADGSTASGSPKVAILYAAKSTEDKRGSIATQLADARAFAEREQRQIVAEFSDEDASAYHGNRGPGLAAAEALAAQQAADGHDVALIVQHSDRLARGDGIEAAHLIDRVRNAWREGYALRSVQDDYTLTDPTGLMAYVMGFRNHEDSKRKSASVAAGKRRSAERGDPHGGWSPYGYRYGDWQRMEDPEPRGLLVVPKEAEIVRRIFREWRGGKPQKAIARDLNRDGIKPQRTKTWGQSSIGRMLRNPAYAALREVNGGLLAANHEAILPRDEWEEAQRRIAPRGTGRRSGRPAPGFLLRSLLVCGECGGRMHCERGRTSYYRCYTNEKSPDACSQRGVRKSHIDEGVLDYFEQSCLDAEASWRASRAAADGRIAETRVLREQAEREAMRLSAQLERADDDYGAGELSASDYARLRQKWGSERDGAIAEAERLQVREAEIDAAASPDFMDRLARVREAVATRVLAAKDDEGIEAVRAALQTLFDAFVVYDAPTQPGAVRSYRVVPRLRGDVASGSALIPGQRVPLVFPPDEEKYHVAEALSYRTPGELTS